MKCSICSNKVEETFLKKPVGTYIKNPKGKQKIVCFECQRRFSNSKEKMLEHMR